MEFPYIKKIEVNDCYTYKNFSINVDGKNDFKHILLTGENGSGKTTILNHIANVLNYEQTGGNIADQLKNLTAVIKNNPGHTGQKAWKEDFKKLSGASLEFSNYSKGVFAVLKSDYVFSYFQAHRKVNMNDVTTVTKQDIFNPLLESSKSEKLSSQLKQYLVNKKVYQAFDLMDGARKGNNENDKFFANLQQLFREIFKDPKLILEFERENFEFYISLSDKRKVTFNQLSEGFSAFLSILMDLLVRSDLIKQEKKDFNYEMPGFVIIDEPETHLHLGMQYEILPLISKLFPKVQLIVATHSPAIISSLKEAVVYDLTAQKQVEDWLLGSSYSELMIEHFGLDNEFSNVADKILNDINTAYKGRNQEELNRILLENEKYLTPSLRLEIESRILELKDEQ